MRLKTPITIVLVFASAWAVMAGSKTANKAKKPGSEWDPNLRLRSISAVVVDMDNRVILYSKNPTVQRSIASITKLMTVLVFLEVTHDLDVPTIIMQEDRLRGSSNFLVGYSYRLMDLLHGTLMASDNLATMALVRSTGLGDEEFVQRMNEKALQLGLRDTQYADPTGLNGENVSTALDCARLIGISMQDSLIAAISTKKSYDCHSLLRRRKTSFGNTNNLLKNHNLQILAGKTGFIRRSGYCLATCVGDGNGKRIAFVVLGAPSNSSRFQEVYKIIRWASRNYNLAIS